MPGGIPSPMLLAFTEDVVVEFPDAWRASNDSRSED
jgi:hypothetical protein